MLNIIFLHPHPRGKASGICLNPIQTGLFYHPHSSGYSGCRFDKPKAATRSILDDFSQQYGSETACGQKKSHFKAAILGKTPYEILQAYP